MTQPQPTHVETPNGGYTFYSEKNADLTTFEGRVAWFCAHFELDAPALKYDPDEPDAVLLTDELIEWFRIEGVSLDWLIAGTCAGPLATYREKYREKSQENV